jgi:hypothetical protein
MPAPDAEGDSYEAAARAMIKARWLRFWHGLFHLTHRNVDFWGQYGARLMGCTCGKVFLKRGILGDENAP